MLNTLLIIGVRVTVKKPLYQQEIKINKKKKTDLFSFQLINKQICPNKSS